MPIRLLAIAAVVLLIAATPAAADEPLRVDIDDVTDALRDARYLTASAVTADERASALAAALPAVGPDIISFVDQTYASRAAAVAERVDNAAVILTAQLSQGDPAAAETLEAWFDDLLDDEQLPAPEQLLAQARETGPQLLSALDRPVAVAVNGVVCPVAGPVSFIDSWGFPRSGGRTHKGQDLFADVGVPLVAVRDATVARIDPIDSYGGGSSGDLGGITIWITDVEGDAWYYAHLSAIAPGLQVGQEVFAGEVLGFNGRSGNARSTPPHLHIQRHPGGGAPVNAYPLLRPACYGS